MGTRFVFQHKLAAEWDASFAQAGLTGLFETLMQAKFWGKFWRLTENLAERAKTEK